MAEVPVEAPVQSGDALTYNLSDMIAFDMRPIESQNEIDAVAKENTLQLLDQLFTQLPQEASSSGAIAHLRNHPEIPDSANSYKLPREKPVPKAKEMTRWEKFAQEKGIQKKKKSKLVWDENEKGWARSYGYKSVKHNADKANFLIEHKQGDEGLENPFKKLKTRTLLCHY